jgi:hypothetical protein
MLFMTNQKNMLSQVGSKDITRIVMSNTFIVSDRPLVSSGRICLINIKADQIAAAIRCRNEVHHDD